MVNSTSSPSNSSHKSNMYIHPHHRGKLPQRQEVLFHDSVDFYNDDDHERTPPEDEEFDV